MAQDRNTNATRIMVYSHDAFGLGNLRRMLAICKHLLHYWPDLSILLVSGSPMIHEFRLPRGLDYIKLPCLNRGTAGKLCAKYLGTSIEETVALRSHLIQLAAVHFEPDLLLVDKKPTGLEGELAATLNDLKNKLPNSKCVLLLRDILDTPKKTVDEWVRWRYYHTIKTYYDQILIVGMSAVFDLVKAYRLPWSIAQKVRYCGYIYKSSEPAELPTVISTDGSERLVLVTPGGGEDGYGLVSHYLSGLNALQQALEPAAQTFRSVIFCGPDMPLAQQRQLQQLAADCQGVTFKRFTNQVLSYLNAADVVVSMGGYNTMTEILSFQKPAVVVPRISPSQEQLIRATRFAKKNWILMIHPDQVTGASLIQAVLRQLSTPLPPPDDIDFNGLPQVAHHLSKLVSPPQSKIAPFIGLSA